MPKISVCIVTHNNIGCVAKAVQTLFSHTKTTELTLYISDNASTDGTVELLTQMFENDGRVKIIRNGKNIGFGKGHNKILDKLDSDYHLILNPDIVLIEDALTTLVAYMENNRNIGIITPKILNPDGSEQFLPKRKPTVKYLLGGRLERFGGVFRKWRTEYTRRGERIEEPVDIEFCTGCFMLIRTEVFRRISGFDERYFMYFEDADLTREVLKTHRTVFFPHMSVVHEWTRMSSKNLKYFLIQLKSMFIYMLKWRKQ